MLVLPLSITNGVAMEWLVIDAIYLRTTGSCVLILRTGQLKMMAEVTSETLVQSGDVLYPVRDAIYLINKNDNQSLKSYVLLHFRLHSGVY